MVLNHEEEDLLPAESGSEHGVLEDKPAHLEKDVAGEIMDVLRATKIAASIFYDLGPADVTVEHSFTLTDEQRMYHSTKRMAPKHDDIVRKETIVMLKADIITPETSTWSFLVKIAAEKDGKARFCVEYRMINQKKKADRFPLLKILELFYGLAKGVFFSRLDFFSGYMQIRVKECCKEKTTFVCRFGTYKFEVMQFGLMNAPSTFQRMIDNLPRKLPFFRVYLDDVVVFSSDIHRHMQYIKEDIELVAGHGLKIRLSKSEFAKMKVTLLGHVIDSHDVRVYPRKVDVIQNASRTTDQKEHRIFLRIAE